MQWRSGSWPSTLSHCKVSWNVSPSNHWRIHNPPDDLIWWWGRITIDLLWRYSRRESRNRSSPKNWRNLSVSNNMEEHRVVRLDLLRNSNYLQSVHNSSSLRILRKNWQRRTLTNREQSIHAWLGHEENVLIVVRYEATHLGLVTIIRNSKPVEENLSEIEEKEKLIGLIGRLLSPTWCTTWCTTWWKWK